MLEIKDDLVSALVVNIVTKVPRCFVVLDSVTLQGEIKDVISVTKKKMKKRKTTTPSIKTL